MIEFEVLFAKCSILSSNVQAKASASYILMSISSSEVLCLWHTWIRIVEMENQEGLELVVAVSINTSILSTYSIGLQTGA